MNLGTVHTAGALRLGWIRRRGWGRWMSATGCAVVVAVFGLVGVHPAEGRADAGPTAGPTGSVVDLPVPPRLLATSEPAEPTTTTTAPPGTTPTMPPPVETTTTTTALSAPQAQAQVQAIADSSGWNWRAAGVRFNVAFYPADCCHWGVYEAAKSVIWVGPTAFEDQNRLRYVVLHELAHAWQYRQNRLAQFITDYTAWGFTTIGPALEAGADCLANVWGAPGGHYWTCPANARALAARRFSGDWR